MDKVFVFFLLACQLGLGAAPWEPLSSHDDLEFENTPFSVYIVRRHNVRDLIEQAANPLQKQRQLWHNRAQTNYLLRFMSNLIGNVYLDRGLLHSIEQRKWVQESYYDGRYASVSVAEYGVPMRVYQTLSAAPDSVVDGGIEVPTETRCLKMGMKPLKRNIRIEWEGVPIRYIPKKGKLEFNEEISAFLSRIPRWVGGFIELKGAAKASDSPHDFGPVEQRLMIRENFSLWTKVPVPWVLPPLQGEMLQKALALRKSHPDIPDELLFPEKQRYIVAEKLLAHTVSRAAAYLYETHAAFESPSNPFFDADFNRKATISEITRTVYETETVDRLAKRPSFELVSKGELSPSDVGVLDCSTLLDPRTWQQRKLPRGWKPGPMILLDASHYVVPTDSYLNMPYPFHPR